MTWFLYVYLPYLLQSRSDEKNWADNCTMKSQSVADAYRNNIVRGANLEILSSVLLLPNGGTRELTS